MINAKHYTHAKNSDEITLIWFRHGQQPARLHHFVTNSKKIIDESHIELPTVLDSPGPDFSFDWLTPRWLITLDKVDAGDNKLILLKIEENHVVEWHNIGFPQELAQKVFHKVIAHPATRTTCFLLGCDGTGDKLLYELDLQGSNSKKIYKKIAKESIPSRFPCKLRTGFCAVAVEGTHLLMLKLPIDYFLAKLATLPRTKRKRFIFDTVQEYNGYEKRKSWFTWLRKLLSLTNSLPNDESRTTPAESKEHGH